MQFSSIYWTFLGKKDLLWIVIKSCGHSWVCTTKNLLLIQKCPQFSQKLSASTACMLATFSMSALQSVIIKTFWIIVFPKVSTIFSKIVRKQCLHACDFFRVWPTIGQTFKNSELLYNPAEYYYCKWFANYRIWHKLFTLIGLDWGKCE